MPTLLVTAKPLLKVTRVPLAVNLQSGRTLINQQVSSVPAHTYPKAIYLTSQAGDRRLMEEILTDTHEPKCHKQVDCFRLGSGKSSRMPL